MKQGLSSQRLLCSILRQSVVPFNLRNILIWGSLYLQVEASFELIHNLSVATASLAKFQRLTLANIQSSNERPGIQTSNESPTIQPEYRQASDTVHDAVASHRKRFYRENLSTPLLQPSQYLSSPVLSRLSPDIDSECCGGLLDCEHLLDKDPGSDNYVTDSDPGSKTTPRLSGLRSTSDYRLGWFGQFYIC